MRKDKEEELKEKIRSVMDSYIPEDCRNVREMFDLSSIQKPNSGEAISSETADAIIHVLSEEIEKSIARKEKKETEIKEMEAEINRIRKLLEKTDPTTETSENSGEPSSENPVSEQKKTPKESFLEDLAMALNDSMSVEMDSAHFVDITANCISFFTSEVMDEDLTEDNINDMPDWMQKTAKEYVEHDLIPIEPTPSYVSFNIMKDFAQMQPDHIARPLFKALSKRRPFANFKIAVRNAGVLQQWYNYKNDKELELAENWLSDNGLEYRDNRICRKDDI